MLDFIQFCKQNDCTDCALKHLKNMLAPDKELTCSILFEIMRVSITEYKGVALKVSQGCGLLEAIRKNSSNRPPLEITITLQEHLLRDAFKHIMETNAKEDDVQTKSKEKSLIDKSDIKPLFDREAILKNAEKCVLHDRNNQYGEPEDIFEDISLLWDSYTKITTQLRDDYKENEFDVCMKQILLKIVRAIHNPEHMDNYIDIAGYAACAGELASKKSIKE